MEDLTSEEVQCLEDEHVFLGAAVNGKRKVSAAMLSPPSSIGNHSSGSSSCSISYQQSGNAAPIEVPETLESVATLEYLGFTKSTAGEIFMDFAARPGGDFNPSTLLDYALGHLAQLSRPQMRDVESQQAMQMLGISEELQSTLLTPQFSNMFESASLYHWLADTMYGRFWGLEKLLNRIRTLGKTLTSKKKQKRQNLDGLFNTSAASSSSSQPPATQSTTSNIVPESEEEFLPRTFVTVADAGPILDDHIVLYKGRSVMEFHGDPQGPKGFIMHDGKFNMNVIRTFGGGDFNPYDDAWYWTEEEAVAEQYRAWAALRNKLCQSWIIRVQLPKAFFPATTQLWFSPDWKEWVWYCKRGYSAGTPPEKFDRFWKKEKGIFDAVHGHIHGKSPAKVQRINKADVQQKMDEDDVLMHGNQKATQVVVLKRETAFLMAEAMRGRTHIEVFAACEK